MKFALCNEFCEGWPLADVLRLARDTGYEGVEIAPFTLAERVTDIGAGERERIRALARSAGVRIIGLHWLLVKPEGLYMNHPNAALRRETMAYMIEQIRFCADIGGDRMVIGSPKQRNVVPGITPETAWELALDTFRGMLPVAEECGVTLCIEPLARKETDFVTTVADGRRMVEDLDHPNFRLHLDVKAMCDEGRPLDEVIREAGGVVGHLHVNDANLNGPGWGETDYEPIVRGLRDIGYNDYASVEVFDFTPGAEAIATRSIAFLRRVFDQE